MRRHPMRRELAKATNGADTKSRRLKGVLRWDMTAHLGEMSSTAEMKSPSRADRTRTATGGTRFDRGRCCCASKRRRTIWGHNRDFAMTADAESEDSPDIE
jgi:hypothetical protein